MEEAAVFGIILVWIIELIFNFTIFYFIVKVIRHTFLRNNTHDYFKNNVVFNKKEKHEYVDISKEQLEKFNTTDLNGLKDMFYKMFEEFEIAYNNLDYDQMKRLTTSQMYNNYYTGIKLDLEVGKKRIINNLKRKKVIIYELDSTIAKQAASVLIEISYINYTIDKNGLIVSGKRYQEITEKFEVTYRKDFIKEDVIKCPNCGATVTGSKCEYCRTDMPTEEWKIHNIKRVLDN